MLKTAECVTPKHPDKLCDQISDAILDACLEQDENSRVAIETMGGHNIITITGEVTTKATVDFAQAARKIVGDDYGVQLNIVKQSQEISRGVNEGGAGDQGIMVGYACDENSSYIPQEFFLARSLCQYIYNLHPQDGKVQVTIDDEKTVTLVVSFCGVEKSELIKITKSWLNVYDIKYLPEKIYANPAGDWTSGGLAADTGLTGRKLVVDNYGPQIPVGGGAFSGKDATKVDRSSAYMARKIAVDYLKKYQAKEVLVKLAYAIGLAQPVMASAQITRKDGKHIHLEIRDYDLKPQSIINFLELKKPQYLEIAKWGSFGRGFKWDN